MLHARARDKENQTLHNPKTPMRTPWRQVQSRSLHAPQTSKRVPLGGKDVNRTVKREIKVFEKQSKSQDNNDDVDHSGSDVGDDGEIVEQTKQVGGPQISSHTQDRSADDDDDDEIETIHTPPPALPDSLYVDVDYSKLSRVPVFRDTGALDAPFEQWAEQALSQLTPYQSPRVDLELRQDRLRRLTYNYKPLARPEAKRIPGYMASTVSVRAKSVKQPPTPVVVRPEPRDPAQETLMRSLQLSAEDLANL